MAGAGLPSTALLDARIAGRGWRTCARHDVERQAGRPPGNSGYFRTDA